MKIKIHLKYYFTISLVKFYELPGNNVNFPGFDQFIGQNKSYVKVNESIKKTLKLHKKKHNILLKYFYKWETQNDNINRIQKQ